MQSSEILLGTVTQANPPAVRTDGASNDTPAIACGGVRVVQDARALVVRAGKRLYLVATSSSDTAYVPTHVIAPAAPTTGTWGLGDIAWEDTPTSGGYVGYVCTAAGTPGTWRGFGLIA